MFPLPEETSGTNPPPRRVHHVLWLRGCILGGKKRIEVGRDSPIPTTFPGGDKLMLVWAMLHSMGESQLQASLG